ncbi:MAG: hypothetical protein K6G52_05325 [Treponemataceae bacterium]|nr:hypothetical protein [Treponemataceae bacterium]
MSLFSPAKFVVKFAEFAADDVVAHPKVIIAKADKTNARLTENNLFVNFLFFIAYP